MGTSTFSANALTSLSNLKAAARIHVIGVCGVAMAQISIQLVKMGYIVSGSDKEFFEPMSSLLKDSAVQCYHGYKPEHVSRNLDLVVIGNSVTSSNPEVLAVQEFGLPYTIFPKLLQEVLIAGKHSIVVSGTHGKSTSTGMLSYVLEQLDLKPSFFVGGKVSQLSSALKVADGSISAVEGDEYDSSFFAKFPKFHFYKPNTLIITSIEFDHADIYSSLDAIKSEFVKLIKEMPPASNVIACSDDAGVRDVIGRIDRTDCNIITYGDNPEAIVHIDFVKGESAAIAASFSLKSQQHCLVKLGIPGRYNLKNAVACILALEAAGVPITEKLLGHFASFKGVDRRQQIWLQSPVLLMEDFAHHPTAVLETLKGIREWLPGRRLIAIFEPRSNTSRKKIFQADYVTAFQQADLVVMKEVEARALDSSQDLFDVNVVCQQISEKGVRAQSFKEIDDIVSWVNQEARVDDVIVVMSNGSFGGLIYKLSSSLTNISK